MVDKELLLEAADYVGRSFYDLSGEMDTAFNITGLMVDGAEVVMRYETRGGSDTLEIVFSRLKPIVDRYELFKASLTEKQDPVGIIIGFHTVARKVAKYLELFESISIMNRPVNDIYTVLTPVSWGVNTPTLFLVRNGGVSDIDPAARVDEVAKTSVVLKLPDRNVAVDPVTVQIIGSIALDGSNRNEHREFVLAHALEAAHHRIDWLYRQLVSFGVPFAESLLYRRTIHQYKLICFHLESYTHLEVIDQ